jgi:mannosyltransferase
MTAPMTISSPKVFGRDTSGSTQNWLAVGVVTIIALILRVIAINRHSFWYDEAIAAQLSHASLHDLFRGIVKDNGNPPLYWMILHLWQKTWGDSESALRSLSVIFGVAAVPLLAILGQQIVNRSAGLFAAALLAISPLAIELSNEARVYALLHLLTIVSMLLFFSWVKRPRGSTWLAYAVSVAALCYSHYFAFFVPIAQGLGLLATRRGRKMLIPWIAAMALAAALWLPWMPIFLHQIHTPGNMSRMGGRWPAQFAATPLEMVFGRTLAWRDSGKILLAALTFAAILLIWIPSLLGLLDIRRRGDLVTIGSWLLLPIALPFLLALTVTPLYHVRAASVGLPALLLLAGAGIASLKPTLRSLTFVAVLSLTSISIARYVAYPLKDDWRDAVPVVLANYSPDQPIIFDTFIEHDSFMYYSLRQHITPQSMIGLTAAPTPGGDLEGVYFENAQRIDTQAHDCSDKIFSAPGVWLILCVPAGTFEQYDALFAQHGYELNNQAHFKRIDLYHYIRKTTK